MRRRWFWIPSVIFGSCSAVVVPGFLSAMQMSKEKRSVANVRQVGWAIEAYAVDHPDWKPALADGSTLRLVPMIGRKYIKEGIPDKDGWGHPLHLALGTKKSGDETVLEYTIWSPGSDGKKDAKWVGHPFPREHLENDIVYSNGSFVQYMEGL